MNNKLLDFNTSKKTAEMPVFRAGDVVKVFRKIIEGGKERTQIFEGMIIAVKGKQSSSSMITVRKVSNGIGVEIVVPIQSPAIEKIELVKRAKVRQSKLYFVRERSAKSLKMKYTDLSAPAKDAKKKKEEVAEIVEEVVETPAEEVKAE
ncbi:MAG: 50S ribosomal protein L19 [Candidatus Moranbacteria bacterium GW2011_GWC2_37_8]|nr:MAG: 50S ribosomal protein L19 [Candidatus Moranbacteria bacterium GW2011_GWC2_37_8]KKQ62305.1 MAG: 50S ribosomal protein L19 [Parcubacteria group bacterium GW2011_GWC1_38_22]